MNPDQPLTAEVVSEYLLSNSFLLSALELFQESLERGQIITPLYDHFTQDAFLSQLPKDRVQEPTRRVKPKNRSALAPTTERDYQKRIKTLEYDLRQDRQNLQTLRKELQDQVLSESSKTEIAALSASASNLETKTLNYLVQQYLISNGYKQSAVSFNQEVGDIYLTDWKKYIGELYGVEETHFPSLCLVYQYFLKGGVNKYEFHYQEALQQQQTAVQRTQQKYEQEQTALAQANKKIQELQLQLEAQTEQNNQLNNTLKEAQTQLKETQQQLEQEKQARVEDAQQIKRVEQTPNITKPTKSKPIEETLAPQEVPFTKRKRNFQSFFSRPDAIVDGGADLSDDVQHLTALSVVDQLSAFSHHMDVEDVAAGSQVVDVVSRCLPGLIKRGVVLKRREEVLPLLAITIAFSSDTTVKQNFTQLLFDFIGIPSEHQRRLIMEAATWLAKQCGPEWTAGELVPLCLSQIASPFVEKRILSADFCGQLGAHLVTDLRLSLLLSLLIQLQQDPSPLVREAVVINTAKLLMIAGQSNDAKNKYPQIEDFVLKLFSDSVPDICRATRHKLFPIFAEWCSQNELLRTHLVSGFFTTIQNIASTAPLSTPMDQISSGKLCSLIELIIQLIPLIYDLMLSHLAQGPHYIGLISSFRDAIATFGQQEQKPRKETTKITLPTPTDQQTNEESEEDSSQESTKETDVDIQITPVDLPDGEGANNNSAPTATQPSTSSTQATPAVVPSATPSTTTSITSAPVSVPSLHQSQSISNPSNSESSLKPKFESIFFDSELSTLNEFFNSYVELASLKEATAGPSSPPSSSIPEVDDQYYVWVNQTILPKIIELSWIINPIQNSSATQSLCLLLVSLTETLGPKWTERIANNVFITYLDNLNEELNQMISTSKGKLDRDSAHSPYAIVLRKRNWMTPLYLAGLCPSIGSQSFKQILNEYIVRIALDQNHWKRSNYNIISTVFTITTNLDSKWIDFHFQLLWDLVVHPTHLVRSLALKLFLAISRIVDERLVAARILPAFITLSADMDSGVRVATIGAFGELAMSTTNPSMLDKIVLQMEMMSAAGDHKLHREMAKVFGKIISQVPDKVRDDFILKELLAFTLDNHTKKQSKKKKGISAILQAYTALSCCTVPLPVQEKLLLPAFQSLLSDDEFLEAREKTTLQDMQKDITAALATEADKKREAEKKPEGVLGVDKKTQEEIITAFDDFSRSLSTRWNMWKDKDSTS